MSTTDGNGTGRPTPEEMQADIDRQREDLARTVDALSHKLDVKSQAQAKVASVKQTAKDRATTDTGKPRPELIAVGVAVVAGVVALVWWRRRR